MQSLLNTIGQWLLTDIWEVARNAMMSISPLSASLIFAVFTVIVMLSAFEVMSRITDFLLNTGLIIALFVLLSVPVGLMLTATPTTQLGLVVLSAMQVIVLIGFWLLLIIGIIFTCLAAYYGKPNSTIIRPFN